MNHNDRLDRKSFKQQQADLIPNDRTKHYQNDKMPDKQKKQQHEHQRSGHTSGNEHKHCSVEQRTGKPIALKWKSTMQTRASSWSSHERLLMSYVQLSLILPLLIVLLASSSLHHQQLSATIAHAQPAGLAFPGVSRDLASFCSARPSLSIDLAPMLVHVKRNTSFNYKLYLFSSDQHVFQTGQIVPRDDFRIHSFPVKLKPLQEFVPIDESSTVQQQQQAGQGSPSASGVEVYELVKETTHNHNGQHSKRPMLIRVPSSSFSPKRFFAQVPLNPDENETPQPMSRASKRSRSAQSLPSALPTTSTTTTTTTTSRPSSRVFPFDVQGDVLPGDHEWISHHDVASHTDAPPTTTTTTKQPQQTNANEHIEFDRDDQVAILSQTANKLRELNRRNSGDQSHVGRGEQQESQSGHRSARSNQHRQHQTMVMPVGSFSSFRVNFTYLARKDFGQVEPELVRLRVDPQRFRVSRVDLLAPIKSEPQRPALNSSSSKDDHQADGQEEAPDDSDYTFLSHKLLRDPNTRITSITQVYEDWITRNFYTIVYIQRRLNMGGGTSSGDDHRDSSEHDDVTLAADELEDSSRYGAGGRGQQQQQQHGRNHRHHNQKQQSRYELVSDRLVFRGSSIVLLGADQLNYHVKASAFITEKNGLHYYLEFLPNGKFYLGAIDWTKRPFKFIDSQRFPIKPTQTQFDNEELLLCPPSVCYSDQPIDELVGYGRLALSDKLQREATILSKSSSSSSSSSLPSPSSMVEHRKGTIVDLLPLQSQHLVANNSSAASTETTVSHQSEPISLDNLIEAMKSGSSRLDVRLHLRDWVWQVPRVQQPVVDGNSKRSQSTNGTTDGITTAHSASSTTSKFAWRYEWARRNEMKVAPDTYGFALVGHEIDASYRVYNELYLISANQLISINYTLANETVTSVHPIEDEFAGLSSSLLDPITGAFYDRYSNQIYFFKGDRYVGYDYATKKPLEEFLLPPAIDDSLGGLGLALMMQQKQQQPLLIASSPTNTMTRTPTINSNNQRMLALAAEPKQPLQSQLVSTLPVVGILGRQHHVDAIYHDLTDDVVYVFAGMKFYTHQANDFKDGAFRTQQGNKGSEHEQPRMHCINEHFLAGCRFDAAYPNPCKGYGRHEGHQDELRHHHYHHYPDELEEEHDGDDDGETNGVAVKHLAKLTEASEPDANRKTASANNNKPERVTSFSEEQQMKLRSIAARGGLMDYLLENTLVAQGAARAFEPFLAQGNSGGGPVSRTSDQEQIVIYLLISMVLVTVLVTVAMIVVVLNWARFKSTDDHQYGTHGKPPSSGDAGPLAQGQLLTERIATPSVISQYLSNKYQQQQQHNRQRQPATYHYGPQPFTPAGRRLSAHRSPMVPLTSPPQIPPPPEPWRRPYRSHHLPDESQSGQANSGVGPNGAGSLDHHPSHGSLVDNSVF